MKQEVIYSQHSTTQSKTERPDVSGSEAKRLESIEQEVKLLRKLVIEQGATNKKLVYFMITNLYLLVTLIAYFLVIAK